MYPVFIDYDNVFCYYCKARITGPFQSSGFAPNRGAWRGECTPCKRVTYFDLRSEVSEFPHA